MKTWTPLKPHTCNVGDIVEIEVRDRTRWNRFLNWLYGRPIPTKIEKFKCIMNSKEGE